MRKPVKFKFKKGVESTCTSDIYYDLFNGYFGDIISNCDKAEELNAAILLLEDFLEHAENKGLIELE